MDSTMDSHVRLPENPTKAYTLHLTRSDHRFLVWNSDTFKCSLCNADSPMAWTPIQPNDTFWGLVDEHGTRHAYACCPECVLNWCKTNGHAMIGWGNIPVSEWFTVCFAMKSPGPPLRSLLDRIPSTVYVVVWTVVFIIFLLHKQPLVMFCLLSTVFLLLLLGMYMAPLVERMPFYVYMVVWIFIAIDTLTHVTPMILVYMLGSVVVTTVLL